MKRLSHLQLALSFAGFFLGAGYVSGQELWQFFGQFGAKGAFGLIFALALILLVGVTTAKLGTLTGLEEVDRLVVQRNIPALRFSVAALEFLFLFGVVCIMTAGVGALMSTLLSVPAFVGSAVFITVVAVISFFGISGMVSAFSFTVPVLCLFTLGFGLDSVIRNGLIFSPPLHNGSGLVGSWFVAAISFACYNVFGSIAMIAPLGKRMKGVGGLVLGAGFLFLIAASVLITVSAVPEYTDAELPMLSYSLNRNAVLGFIYGALLLLAMFGTALSSFVGFVNMAKLKFQAVSEHEKLFSCVCAAVAFIGSLFGFGDLIGVIYPLFGYCSSVFIVMLIVHYFKIRRVKTENY